MIETRGGQRCSKKSKDQSASDVFGPLLEHRRVMPDSFQNVHQTKRPHDSAAEPFSVKTRSDEKKCQNQFLLVGIGDDTLKSIGTRIRLPYPASIETKPSARWVTLLLQSEICPTSSAAGCIYMMLARDVDRTDLAWVKIGKTKDPKVRHRYWNCHFPSPKFVTYWKEFRTITMDEVERKYADNGSRCMY